MRQPKSLDEAKQMFREEKAKVTASLSAIAGSRWLLAIVASVALTFGCHLIYAPGRLPAMNWLQWRNTGLPQSLDFGVVGEQWNEMIAAAERNDVAARAQETLAANQDYYVVINAAVFAVACVLLVINLWIMTKRRAYTRG